VLLWRQSDVAQRLLGLELGVQPFEQRRFDGVLLPVFDLALLALLVQPRQPVFDADQIHQQELAVDRLQVPDRVDRLLGMRHGRVLERADDVHKGVHLLELVAHRPAQAALPDAFVQPADVGIGDGGVGGFLGLEDRAQPVDARVGHVHDGSVHLELAGRERLGG